MSYQPPPQGNIPPYQQYPNQPPPPQGYPPYAPPPKKKSKLWLWIVLGLVAVFALCSIISNASTGSGTTNSTANTQVTPAANDKATTPTQPPKAKSYQTIKEFSGNGTQETEKFTVGNEWKLLWTCDPASFSFEYNVAVQIKKSADSFGDLAVNTICKEGNTSGETIKHKGGEIFLDISSTAAWTITIQELK